MLLKGYNYIHSIQSDGKWYHILSSTEHNATVNV